jgi:two-component system, NtrC family, nitrogen regulation sensor histidine kinase NtrY
MKKQGDKMQLIRWIAQLSAILVIFACFFLLKDQNKINEEKELQKIQKSFQEQEKILFDLENEIPKIIEQENIFSPKTISKISLYDKKGILIFIEENNELKFWNSNALVFDKSKLSGKNKELIRFNNGWYYLIKTKTPQQKIYLLAQLKSEYPFQNKYVQNHFHSSYNTKVNAEISPEKGFYQITNIDNDFVFSVIFSPTQQKNQLIFYILLGFYLLLIIFIPLFIGETLVFISKKKQLKSLSTFVSVFFIISIRVLSQYFHYPALLYQEDFFSPLYFAGSSCLPSLGDLFVNSFLLAICIVILYRRLNFAFLQKIAIHFRILIAFLLLLAAIVLLDKFFAIFIFNSTIDLGFRSVFKISFLAIISMLAVFCISFSLLLPPFIMLKMEKQTRPKVSILLAISFVIILAYFLVERNLLLSLFLAFLYVLVSLQLLIKKNVLQSSFILLLLLFFSLFLTNRINTYIDAKEQEERKMRAVSLAEERDPIAEYQFDEIEEKILQDDSLKSKLANKNFNEAIVSEYIINNYFSNYWAKYNKRITYCYETDLLLLENENKEIPCYVFFQNMINSIGIPTFNPNLYFLKDGSGKNRYFCQLAFFQEDSSTTNLNVFIELNSILMPQRLGYPELLIDENINITSFNKDYTFAKYKNNELIYRYGDFFYWFYLPENITTTAEYDFFDNAGYNHLVYHTDNNTSIVVGKETESIIQKISPLAYIVIIFALLLLFFVYFIKAPINFRALFELTFQTRIQFSIAVLIVISFIIIGISSIIYIYQNNESKNKDILTEKTHSVLIEVEHKIAESDDLSEVDKNYFSNLLYKFSNVFFSDIHFFDTKGNLFTTSRPEVFEEALLSRQINPEAYFQLNEQNKSFYVHEEKIADMKYLSAYVPFLNYKGKKLGYINLPYFAKQEEMKMEISSYISTFLNIYLMLIALAIALGIFVSGYLSRPLKTIQESMRKISLGRANEKIQWKKNDEIGDMIKEYNRMIDELDKSAKMLAKTEREMAWREMAKQVAHEIKNPLTPMKLNVQYIKKVWNDESIDKAEQIKKFSERLIEQIDALSDIATAFSDFAQMPQTKISSINIIEVIENAVDLFQKGSSLKIQLINESKEKEILVNADKNQMLRVFNNLIKNAEQAMEGLIEQSIIIRINSMEEDVFISVEDKGCGIPPEMHEKIFIPKFTTKTAGKGLGLPMIKNIINAVGGKIWFDSIVDKGTTFYILMKKSKTEEE